MNYNTNIYSNIKCEWWNSKKIKFKDEKNSNRMNNVFNSIFRLNPS